LEVRWNFYIVQASTNSSIRISLDYDLVGTQIAGYSDTYWRNYEIYKSEIYINPEVFDNYPDNYLSQLYLHEYGPTIGLAHTSDGGLWITHMDMTGDPKLLPIHQRTTYFLSYRPLQPGQKEGNNLWN
jgi:predicted Zn-dependent protease